MRAAAKGRQQQQQRRQPDAVSDARYIEMDDFVHSESEKQELIVR